MKRTVIALSYAFCWGIGVTLTKIALAEIRPTTLLIIQLTSSVLFLAVVCYLKNRRLPFSWGALKQGAAGVFEPALAYMVGTLGVALTTASNATLIGSTEVILTVLFAAIFLGERLTSRKILLTVVSFSGVLLLVTNNLQGVGSGSLLGDLLVLLATVFAVMYVLFSKRQIETAEPLLLTTSQQTVGLLTTVICFGTFSSLRPDFAIQLTGIPLGFWALAVGSGILQYALAYLLYLTALRRIPASQAAFYIALIPVFGVGSAIVLIGEQPSPIQWLGGLLVIGSSYYANRLSA